MPACCHTYTLRCCCADMLRWCNVGVLFIVLSRGSVDMLECLLSGCRADMSSCWHADMVHADMLTCCHAEILMSGSCCGATCWQAPERVPEQVPPWLFFAASLCLHSCRHMCYATYCRVVTLMSYGKGSTQHLVNLRCCRC